MLALIGVPFNRFFFQPVLAHATREENRMLLAVGTALLLENLALTVFGEKQRGVPPVVDGAFIFGDVAEGGAILTYPNALVALLAAVFILGLLAFVQYTRPGRAMRAVAQDKEAARLQGVDVPKLRRRWASRSAPRSPGLAGGLLVTVYGVNAGVGAGDLDQGLHHDHDRRRRGHLGRDRRRRGARLRRGDRLRPAARQRDLPADLRRDDRVPDRSSRTGMLGKPWG